MLRSEEVHAFLKEGHTPEEAMEKFQMSREAVRIANTRGELKANGGEPREGRGNGNREQRIYDYVHVENHTTEQAASHFGVKKHTIQDAISRVRKRMKNLPRGSYKQICAYVQEGHTHEETAEKFGIEIKQVRDALYWTAGAPGKKARGVDPVAFAQRHGTPRYEEITRYVLDGHSYAEAAVHFKTNVHNVRNALQYAKKVSGRVIVTKTEVVPKLTRNIYTFSRMLEKAVIEDSHERGEVSELGLTALALTHEIRKMEKSGG